MSLLRALQLPPLPTTGGNAAVKTAPGGTAAVKTAPGSSAAVKTAPGGTAAVKTAPGGTAAVKTTPAARAGKLSQAAETWRKTHGQANERIAALKAAVLAHHSDGHPELIQEIEKGLAKLDTVMDNIDHRLADSLAKASGLTEEAARAEELKNAKAIFTEYITYVKGEPLIAHMDENPFGVKTGLKALLVSGLTNAATAIG